jgi:class 3 adenylate cyclase
MCHNGTTMVHAAGDPIAAGREAAGRRSWQEAYTLLSSADSRLSAQDLQGLADAAFFTGRLDEALSFRERAYKAYLDEDNRLHAAGMAIRLSLDYLVKANLPLFSGWLAKGERILTDEPESREHGQAALVHAFQSAEVLGKFDDAIEQAGRAFEIGERFGDADLQALSLVVQGTARVFRGELDAGLALLDEASTSALTGELDPFSSTVVYCMTITGAQGVGDFERARQWTEAANRWCDAEQTNGFPAACRVHRSEILWLGGQWEEAEREAVTACSQLEAYNVFTTAAGYYQIGEIRRRRGDFSAAEEAYRKAHELGRDPQPGQALLRLAQGNVAEALAALDRSLDARADDLLSRARRLPAQVDVSLAVGDIAAAKAAAAELEELTDRFRVGGERTPLLDGSLHLSLARIATAEEEWSAAEGTAREALAVWTGVGAPYEAAEARIALGMAYEHKGDRSGATAEYEAAKAAFERLGAVLDSQRTMELLGETAATHRTFVFTDIVDSTKLLEALGPDKWKKLLDRHDALLTEAIRQHDGEVIKHTGDGFFAAFDTAQAAVEAAVRIQRALDDEVFAVRIGIHSGEALERGSDYTGRGVNVAARIGALAGAGEILVSTESLDGATISYALSETRAAELKGFAEAVPIAAVSYRRAG